MEEGPGMAPPPAPAALPFVRPLRTFDLDVPPAEAPAIAPVVVALGALAFNATAEGPGSVYFARWYGADDPRNAVERLTDKVQTPNRALLRAALATLKATPRDMPLELRTTSEYLPKIIYSGPLARWRRSKWTAPDIKNKQLWQQVDEAMDRRPGKVVWKHASKAEQADVQRAVEAAARRGLPAVAVTLSVQAPTIRPSPPLYGCWFGPGDARNVVGQPEGPLTESRATVKAALLALRNIAADSKDVAVEIRTSSNYVLQAVRLLPKWHERGWTAADGQPVSNADLWRELWAVLQERPDIQVTWQFLWRSADQQIQASLFPPALQRKTAAWTPATPPTTATVVYTTVVWPQGKGAPAVYGLWFGQDDPRNQVKVSASSGQSQNKVELEAVNAALAYLVLQGVQEVELRTHSLYIVQNQPRLEEWRDNQWRKRKGVTISHLEEWMQLDNFLRSGLLRVMFRYVELLEQREAIKDVARRATPLLPSSAIAPSTGLASLLTQLDPLPLPVKGTAMAYIAIFWPQGWAHPPVYGLWFGAEDPRTVVAVETEDLAPYQSQNRAELRAAVRAVRGAGGPRGGRLEVRTQCKYLETGYLQLPTWQAQAWRLADGAEVSNADLWGELLAARAATGLRLKFRYVPRDIYTAAHADLHARVAQLPPRTSAAASPSNTAPLPPAPAQSTAGTGIAALVAAAVSEPGLAGPPRAAAPPPVIVGAIRAALPALMTEMGVPADRQAEVAEEALAPGQALEAMWAAAKTAAALNVSPQEVERTVATVLDGALRFSYDRVKERAPIA